MRIRCPVRTRLLIGALALMLLACAGYSGSNLKPGSSSLGEVVASMGEPAMRWKDDDGRQQLAYPRGPEGPQTYMAFIGADGLLERIEAVLDEKHFARIEVARSDRAAVSRLLGPPLSTAYFKARDELIWEWRIDDAWHQRAFFGVVFDAQSGVVRSTYQRTDYPLDFGV